MINEHESRDEEQEYTCRRCGSPYCDGLKNCDICGEDTYCGKRLCQNCTDQERIEEAFNDPDFDPSYYR